MRIIDVYPVEHMAQVVSSNRRKFHNYDLHFQPDEAALLANLILVLDITQTFELTMILIE